MTMAEKKRVLFLFYLVSMLGTTFAQSVTGKWIKLNLQDLITDNGTALNPRQPTSNAPEIKDGAPCVQGRVYRQGCNSCHCIAKSRLLCTKMACLTRSQKNIRSNDETCDPGTFIEKGCRRCFCNEEKRLLCGPENCTTVGKVPTTHETIHTHSKYPPEEQHRLPTLPHQGSNCRPGASYRVDCNTCLCLANGDLQCGRLFCPSHNDVHKVKAKDMTGKPCSTIGLVKQDLECVLCWCVDGKHVCQAKLNCLPSQRHVPIEDTASQCVPGMIYKQSCNRCSCTENRTLYCTMKSCLKRSQAEHVEKQRKPFMDMTQKSGTGTDV